MGKTRTSATGRPRLGGFTLVEMLVVLAIMVGLTAAFPLAWQRLSPQRQVEVYARRMASDLRLLRAEAMRSNASTTLSVANDAHGYQLTPDDIRRELPDAIELQISLPIGAIASPAGALQFYPDGSSSGGKIVLQRAGRQATLAVSPLSGRIAQE